MHGNVATPFLEVHSFMAGETDEAMQEASSRDEISTRSPFISVYELEGQTEYLDAQSEAYSTLVQDFHDEEFDVAVQELIDHVRGIHEENMLASYRSVDTESQFNQYFKQLTSEAEGVVNRFATEFGGREAASLGETELEDFADNLTFASSANPEFEDFLGKWAKKLAKGVKSIAKKAGSFAVKLGLGPVLSRIKPLVMPMLRKVLQKALGQLPASVRGPAQMLASKFFDQQPAAAAVTEPTPAADPTDAAAEPAGATDGTGAAEPDPAVQAPPEADVSEIQFEFDQHMANLVMAETEEEQEMEIAQARSDARQATVPVYAELDQAREKFIGEINQLKDGESSAPVIQEFVMAILPAIRLGIRLIGRGRVVNFLSGFMAKVISKMIGPAAAPQLSRAIVETGLKMLSLELNEQEKSSAAASSIAATVEETVRRISALPGHILDNQELLEGYALEAFEQAAAANLPPILSQELYRDRPDLLESRNGNGCWVMLPLRRRKRFKKYGRMFNIRITPFIADEIETFEGPLSEHLQDQYGMEEGEDLEAEVQLYEALPGTNLSDIAREDNEMSGAMQSMLGEEEQFHPLTKKAAGLLLGEPKLGRNPTAGSDRMRVDAGQRFYRLKVPGKRILTVPDKNGRLVPRKRGGLRMTLDCVKGQVRVRIFLSELRAQRLAVKLRRQSHNGPISVGLSRYLDRRLGMIVGGRRWRRIKIIQPGLAPGETTGAALRNLPPEVHGAMVAALHKLLVPSFADFVKSSAPKIIAATEDAADGITFTFVADGVSGLQQFGKALLPNGQSKGVAVALRQASKPAVQVQVLPGLVHE